MTVSNIARTTGCCDSLYNTGASGVHWIQTRSKTLAGSFSETAKDAWTKVSNLASRLFARLSVYFATARTYISDAFVKAKDGFMALPTEAKGLVAATFVLAAGTGAWMHSCCTPKPVAPNVAVNVAATTTPAANPAAVVAAAPVANAAAPVANAPAAVAAAPAAPVDNAPAGNVVAVVAPGAPGNPAVVAAAAPAPAAAAV